jgi:adenine/guanine phosphoribosyltransferase-like PRPP-binding protein
MRSFEKTIRKRGAIKFKEFTSHAGELGNCKIELDNEFMLANPKLANEITRELAGKLEPYKAEIIVPVPRGANLLGQMVAKELGIGCILLDKQEYTRDVYIFNNEEERQRIIEAEAIGLVDDVYRKGSSLTELSRKPEFEGSVVVAGVIWDRSHPADIKNFPFEIESLVQRYVPLRVGRVS